jgi:hypothetical protein
MKDGKAYGFQGSMNPQTKMKGDMSPSKSYKGKGNSKSEYKGKSGHDMSPPIKTTDSQPIWQNMR